MNKYLVALHTGGIQGDPIVQYSEYQIIDAIDSKAASKEYNERNRCSYFYGGTMAGIEHGKLVVFNKSTPLKEIEFLQASEISSEKDMHNYWINLTSEQRLLLVSFICQSCGDLDPNCQCWNDE